MEELARKVGYLTPADESYANLKTDRLCLCFFGGVPYHSLLPAAKPHARGKSTFRDASKDRAR